MKKSLGWKTYVGWGDAIISTNEGWRHNVCMEVRHFYLGIKITINAKLTRMNHNKP